MKYYIIAGEASGDLHASNMMKALKKLDPEAIFRCWGGDLMQHAGGILVKHYKDLAFMGFKDVLLNLPTILNNISFCKKDIMQYKPDAVIFIDYPGFNLRIAPFAKKLGIKTFYYISPTVWAWKANRAHNIKRYIDKLFVILPFEKDFYWNYCQYEVCYVGHPLLDAIITYKETTQDKHKETFNLTGKPLVLLMAGSRTREIKDFLPLLSELPLRYPQYEFIIAAAPGQSPEIYQKYSKTPLKIISNRTYDLLQNAYAVIAKSGTVTLETALFKVPELLVYKGDALSWWIAKNFLVKKLKYIGLPNLIMDEEIIPELLQEDFNLENLCKNFELLCQEEYRIKQNLAYEQLIEKLGKEGASNRVASEIITIMKK